MYGLAARHTTQPTQVRLCAMSHEDACQRPGVDQLSHACCHDAVMSAGYENIVQIRALLEGVQVSDILHRWHEVLPQKMQEWDVGRAQLVELFGSTRDQWMGEDLQGWLAPNRMYPKVTEAMKTAMASEEFEAYIVTTKQVCRKANACLLQLKYGQRCT
jgi:hypothetical protein